MCISFYSYLNLAVVSIRYMKLLIDLKGASSLIAVTISVGYLLRQGAYLSFQYRELHLQLKRKLIVARIVFLWSLLICTAT